MDDVSSTLLFFENFYFLKKKKLEVFTWTSSLRRAWVFFSGIIHELDVLSQATHDLFFLLFFKFNFQLISSFLFLHF